jgi:Cytochrome c biogenesis factor
MAQKIILTIMIIAGFYVWSGRKISPHADQKDPRLPNLFQQLALAANAQAAQRTAAEIWRIWSERSDDESLANLLKQGTSLMNAGRLREAEILFTNIIEKAPDFAEAWNKRATVYFLMRSYDQSKKDIAQTLIREPKHFGALSGLGLIEAQIGNYDAALDAYEKAVEIHPFLEGYKEIVDGLKKLIQGTAV